MGVPVPTLRLAIVAGVASLVVAAVPTDLAIWKLLLLVDGALVVVALVDALLAPRPDVVRVRRDLPGVLALGGHGDVTWRIGNSGRRRLRVSVADELAPSLRPGDRLRLRLR